MAYLSDDLNLDFRIFCFTENVTVGPVNTFCHVAEVDIKLFGGKHLCGKKKEISQNKNTKMKFTKNSLGDVALNLFLFLDVSVAFERNESCPPPPPPFFLQTLKVE